LRVMREQRERERERTDGCQPKQPSVRQSKGRGNDPEVVDIGRGEGDELGEDEPERDEGEEVDAADGELVFG
jgi:hypothetical protein